MFLLRSADNFEKSYFRVTKLILQYLHMWPNENAEFTRRSLVVVGFNVTSIFLLIFGSFNYAREAMDKDLGLALRAVCPSITITPSYVKLLYFLYHRKDFGAMVFNLQRHLEKDVVSPKKNAIVAKFSSTSMKFTFMLLVFGFFTNFFYALTPIISFVSYKYFNREATPITEEYTNSTDSYMLELPFAISMPFFSWSSISSTIFYKLVFLASALSGNSTICVFSAVDGAFMCFCLYLSAALQAVQLDFQEAFDKYYDVEFLSQAQNDELYAKLAGLLHRRSDLVKMSKDLSRFYVPLILLHFIFSALSIGMSSLLLISLSKGFEKTIYIAYDLGVGTQLYIYCSGAEYLNENTSNFADICYDCAWYKCNKRVRSLIILSMVGAQRGCQMEVPFFKPSLQVFQAIIRTAGSYITLLQTFL